MVSPDACATIPNRPRPFRAPDCGTYSHERALEAGVKYLTLAGTPLTVGFVAKLYLFTAGVDGGLWLLLGTLIAGSVIGLFYYLRVIIYLIGEPAPGPAAVTAGWPGPVTLAVVLVLLVLFGVFPVPLVSWVRASVLMMVS